LHIPLLREQGEGNDIMEKANNQNLWHYNKQLKRYANQNRSDMTKAEACLWKFVLGKRQMQGYQFRRQRPVLNYIADFLCKELMLIIEVDGVTHQWEEVDKNDCVRQRKLEEIGFKVLRFNDEEVLNDITNVIRTLENYICEFEKTTPFDSPASGGHGGST
jgi:very-short-patch-repair endonuclease